MNHARELIKLKADLPPHHPMTERLHQWHWNFRMGKAEPMDAVRLLEDLQASTWTPEQEIEHLRMKVKILES